jgi:hypothetical protein
MPQSLADELSSIPTSPNLGQSLERAHRFAREQSHKAVTLEHLLLALTEDAEAALILQSANIELARLSTDVSGYLGRLLEDMRSEGASEPRPDADLLRVMQAAASAAKQSRRRQIDGAIVLAAIVGDGKSPAAGMLKALGMTFEEAIRALQRANTKARLKPAAKPAEAAPKPSRALPEAPPSAVAEPAQPASEDPAAAPEATPSSPATTAGVSQSAEEILAAARARIQQRAAGAVPKIEPPRRGEKPRAETAPADSASAAPDADTPPSGPADGAATDALTEAIEAAMSGTVARPAELAPPAEPAPAPVKSMPLPVAAPVPPPAPPIAQPSQPRAPWAPPAPPEPLPRPGPPPAQRLPQPPPPATARSQPPLPARLIAPGEGPRRPPLPPPGAPQPPPGFPNRPPRAPWPEPGEHQALARPPLANGSYGGAPPAPPLAPSPSAGRPPQPTAPHTLQRGPGHADKGLLVESVPRRMRLGVPASAEVRIARDRIEALIATLSTRGSAPLAEQPLMRALSVRLRAPGGDFWIEPAAPETQWVDSASSLIHDDYATWRWTVVARRRGRGRLSLMVSARTVGRDGVAAESAPPDRIIEVRIGSNWGQAIRRWVGWSLAVLAGAAIGHFGEQIWTLASLLIQQRL